MRDLLIAENVSKRDARLLQAWWSRRGYVDLRAPEGRGRRGKGRFSVWLERLNDSRARGAKG